MTSRTPKKPATALEKALFWIGLANAVMFPQQTVAVCAVLYLFMLHDND